MTHHSSDNHNHVSIGPEKVDATELRDYVKHNIRHLEEHVKIFMKLQTKIEDQHALESLQSAIDSLLHGILELKNVLSHLNE